MKSVKQINKRAFSPIAPKNESSERKKKSNSNYPNNPYQPHKEFDSSVNRDKKRPSNYLKEILKQQADPMSKYRIVTEPVDDRIMTIVSSSFLPSRSKGKLDYEVNSKSRQLSNQKRNNPHSLCPNCRNYIDEINAFKSELGHIMTSKVMWKSGQLSLGNLKEEYGLGKKGKGGACKSSDGVLFEVRRHFYDLMRDIETLAEIDFAKMLSLKIFKHQEQFQAPKPKEEDEVKSLLAQLRNHYEGKLNAWDLEDESEESDHVKAIVRNLKSRLAYYLRQNLQLRAKKAIMEKAEQISLESEEYLRQIVEDVLHSYSKRI